LTLLTDGNGKNGSTVATVGENPSAKGRLPDVYLLTKIPLNNYKPTYPRDRSIHSVCSVFTKESAKINVICGFFLHGNHMQPQKTPKDTKMLFPLFS
jgi:hypothetical protein